jgi:hypothetical protein
MYVSVVNVSFMEFDDVRMVNLSQYGKLFLQQFDIFLNVLLEYAFDGVLYLGIRYPVRNPH